ncbi:FxsA family protein [Caldalkalibacillus mannanilyticus]|uniref:FxsA family protein n=1 Tax=Caldalkalibacillus mannanilyticus TaxID=1418 RepID=UPI000468A0C0|nr:FxsA family protein [Caldalkalibacillus mannanilyticus]
MFRILVLMLIIVPVIELWGLISVGKWIGAWPTVGLVILTGIIGAWLAKREGLQTLQLVRLQLEKGEMPGQAVLDGICILVGGAVLLTPGFFTDIVGFFLLVPYTRNIVKAMLRKWFEKWIKHGHFTIIKR